MAATDRRRLELVPPPPQAPLTRLSPHPAHPAPLPAARARAATSAGPGRMQVPLASPGVAASRARLAGWRTAGVHRQLVVVALVRRRPIGTLLPGALLLDASVKRPCRRGYRSQQRGAA